MNGKLSGPVIREAVGIFENAEALEQAIDDLLSAGFDQAAMSLLAEESTVEQRLGYRYRKVEEVDDVPSMPRTAYLSPDAIVDAKDGLPAGLLYVGSTATGPVVASGGTLAATLFAVSQCTGAGGAIATLLARLIGEHDARQLGRLLECGRLLLWVQVGKPAQEACAMRVLAAHSGVDTRLYALPARLPPARASDDLRET